MGVVLKYTLWLSTLCSSGTRSRVFRPSDRPVKLRSGPGPGTPSASQCPHVIFGIKGW
jgi:hypothetical protein